MNEAIWFEDDDVEAALARLGLSLPPLTKAVRFGYVSRISRTANDAPNAAGFYQWNDTLRILREELVLTHQWYRRDSNNFATIVHPDGVVAIAVSSGNSGTGRRNERPSTRRLKGACTDALVNTNAIQLELFPEGTIPGPKADAPHQAMTWMLLFFTDEDEIRSELSLPDRMDDGEIVSWKTRIILPSQPIDPVLDIRPPDFGPEVDISIQRR